ncbi:Retrovirus-related Pol polyprotein from transposon, partial [Sarcoptes scabiei]
DVNFIETVVPRIGLKSLDEIEKNLVAESNRNDKISIIGSMFVEVAINKTKLNHSVLISNEITHAIFGLDLMFKLNTVWDAKGNFMFHLDGNPDCIKLIKEETHMNLCMSHEEICNLFLEDLTIEEEAFENRDIDAKARKIIENFSNLKHKSKQKTPLIKHRIELRPESSPINLKQYRFSKDLEERIENRLKRMLEDKIIERSTSLWSSQLVATVTNDQTLRLAIDYRKLNKMINFNSRPSLKLYELLSGLRDAKIFSRISLAKAFYQIPLMECDKEKTAFRFRNDHYQFKVMPYGLANSSQTFMHLMDSLFSDKSFVKYSIDGILIFSKDEELHAEHLKKILSILSDASLSLSLKGSNFFQKEIEFFGLFIKHNKILIAKEESRVIQQYEAPKNAKELKRFLEIASNYRKFIENFASITLPLYNISRKGAKFDWQEQEREAFDLLKRKFLSEPILIIPDFYRPFYVRIFANDVAICGTLIQKDDFDDTLIIEYFSEIYTENHLKLSTVEKEIFTLATIVENWSYYLKYRKFIVQIDAQLSSLSQDSISSPHKKLTRLRQNYQFSIENIST